MAPVREVLRFNTDFDPQTGALVAVAPGIGRVTAPNAGPYTFTGTNSFLIGDASLVVNIVLNYETGVCFEGNYTTARKDSRTSFIARQ